MATKVIMPQLGESVTDGTIVRWLKKEGEHLQRFEPLAEVETAKVVTEIPSPIAGVLERLLVPEGATVLVGVEIAIIAEVSPVGAEATATATASRPTSAPGPEAPPSPEPEAETAGTPQRFSPVVRRMAQEQGLDLTQVQGTGLGGRVTKEDVLRHLEQQRASGASQRSQGQPATTTGQQATPVPLSSTDEEVVLLTPTRRAIAEHMLRSQRLSPHAWTMMEAEVSGLVKLREGMKAEFRRREEVDLTYLPFFIKAVAESLKEHPLLNAQWGEDKVIVKKRIHIGVAVDAPEGLIVPVIHDAGHKSIAGLARDLHDLINRARERKLAVKDVEGGTFTVNNTGALGSIISYPIINQPQAAIITMEAIVKRPVVLEGDSIAIRSMMNLCLAFDHRVLDGAEAGRFLQSVKRRLESMGPDTPVY